MNINMQEMGKRARAAARKLARAGRDQKDQALERIASNLEAGQEQILQANAIDVDAGRKNGLSEALLDRLTLNPSRLAGIISDLHNLMTLPDPVGEIFEQNTLPNGLCVQKQRVPIGVLGVIYEARPNVTLDVAGLALKTGNAVILRGGSETLNSNRILVEIIRSALAESGLPTDAVQFIDDPDRERVTELLQMDKYVDMLIPRGGAGLHEFCRQNSRIPVITGGIGICHLFVDESADLAGALRVIQNAKVQRPSVCNALDTVLVHQKIAETFLPQLVEYLQPDGVSFRAHESALPLLAIQSTNAHPGQGSESPSASQMSRFLPGSVTPAGPQDFDTEWLSLVLGLKVVSGLEEAVEHITEHSTQHSDGILTRDDLNAQRFVSEVNSAAVYVNASTRFTDGAQLGLGAEVAISTQPLHARGPMGLRELTTYKWVITGENHIRE